jgi:hypothetical protein
MKKKLLLFLGYFLVVLPLLLIGMAMIFQSIAPLLIIAALVITLPCEFLGLGLCYKL